MVREEEERGIKISRKFCVQMTRRKGRHLQDGGLVWSEGVSGVLSHRVHLGSSFCLWAREGVESRRMAVACSGAGAALPGVRFPARVPGTPREDRRAI